MDVLIIILLLAIVAELTFVAARVVPQKGIRKDKRRIFVDTSVLIDGRIVAVAQSGFISDVLAIPRSVIGELQFLADNGDSDKRTRARHGLDVVAELQALEEVVVEIFPDGSHAEEGVDERLLKLAKQYGGALCTIDYNLNKVAAVEGTTVLNVNDLARSLRMAYLPGEKITIALTTKGNDNTQAVGHLEDGTMVVVEQAKSKIGSVVEAEIIRSLQTSAGRMMFARLTEKTRSPANKQATVQAQKAEAKQVNGKKASGRRAPSTQESKKKTSLRKKSTHAAASKNKTTPPSSEDRLIELVNNQD